MDARQYWFTIGEVTQHDGEMFLARCRIDKSMQLKDRPGRWQTAIRHVVKLIGYARAIRGGVIVRKRRAARYGAGL